MNKTLTKPKQTVQTRRPNNVYILSDEECCEVVAISREAEHEDRILLCHVYGQLEPCFVETCDLRLIGAYKAQLSCSRMKTLPERLLDRKAVMIGSRIVLAVLHSF